MPLKMRKFCEQWGADLDFEGPFSNRIVSLKCANFATIINAINEWLGVLKSASLTLAKNVNIFAKFRSKLEES